MPWHDAPASQVVCPEASHCHVRDVLGSHHGCERESQPCLSLQHRRRYLRCKFLPLGCRYPDGSLIAANVVGAEQRCPSPFLRRLVFRHCREKPRLRHPPSAQGASGPRCHGCYQKTNHQITYPEQTNSSHLPSPPIMGPAAKKRECMQCLQLSTRNPIEDGLAFCSARFRSNAPRIPSYRFHSPVIPHVGHDCGTS